MNDAENTIDWKVGDLVLHDADSKEKRMLMRVIAIDKDALYVTQYAFPEKIIPNCLYRKYGTYDKIPKRVLTDYTKKYKNDKKYLHDPQIFGIDINMVRIYGIDG